MKRILIGFLLVITLIGCIKPVVANQETEEEVGNEIIYQNRLWTIMYINDSTLLCIPGNDNPAEGEKKKKKIIQIKDERRAEEIIDEVS